MAQGAVISNLNGTVFEKGYMYGTRRPGGVAAATDGVTFGALQNVEISHEFTFSELDGPESLAPLGVGVKGESLTGSWEFGVITPGQLVMALGGSAAYDGGANKTTFTKLVDEEPSPFDLHFKSAPTNPDMEVNLYNCLAPSWNIIRADNRAFSMGRGQFRCYGQAVADGGKLFEVIKPGNLTTSS